ncbi:MAG: hypothetical protein AUH29_05590 [Candidatus Rokubacteria bacterium 13_1_40CM_69_27]|nr:MAG: hypothetical protein AUH29_05590 [Candidatus Rokubacteria bacterium 13_1_40CM_69_27]OLC32470.1 MAG: hypothetical protein AUH81_16130 [Candidatus Rokubacteria bacterium 13_1_40CM_4_69_5]
MLNLLGPIIVAIVPLASVVALLLLVTRRERVRDALVACQVAVTDAIHQELGAIVSPTMRKRSWGRCQLVIAVPLERPAVVGRVLTLAHGALDRGGGIAGRRVEIVLIPQPERGHAAGERAA